MKSDFDLIVHRLPECKEARLYAIGDLHVGAIEANIKGWEQFVQKILQDKNAYIVILGDMMNNATRSSVSNVFDDTMRPRDQKKYLMGALKSLTERILCIVPGNHEQRNKDVDDEPLYDVACKLDLEDIYRPNCAFVKVCFGNRDKGGQTVPLQTYVLAVTHGAGGGASTTNVSFDASDPTTNVYYVDQNGTAQSWVVDPLYPGGFSATVPSKSLLTYTCRNTSQPSNYSNCSLITTKTGGSGNTKYVCIIQAD